MVCAGGLQIMMHVKDERTSPLWGYIRFSDRLRNWRLRFGRIIVGSNRHILRDRCEWLFVRQWSASSEDCLYENEPLYQIYHHNAVVRDVISQSSAGDDKHGPHLRMFLLRDDYRDIMAECWLSSQFEIATTHCSWSLLIGCYYYYYSRYCY